MKVDFSKNIGILKKNKIEALEMKSSLCQIKNSVESLSSSLNQMGDRISGLKTK
jgi:hypothetical protein